MKTICEKIEQGVLLSELTGYSDGDRCARNKEQVGFLIVSGGEKEIDDVYRVLDADAVAFGYAAIRDGELCGRLQTLLKRGCCRGHE